MAKFKKQCTSGDKASRYILLLNVTYKTGDVSTNKTPVSYILQLAGGNYDGDNYNQYGSSFTGYTCNGSIAIKNKKTGATLKTSTGSSKGSVSNTSAITIASGSFDAPHNDDGTLTLSISGTFTGGLSTQASGGFVSGDVVLPTIARASGITATDAFIESATTINIDKKNDSFTTTITYTFGDLTDTIVTKTSNNSVRWTIPESFYEQIPDSPNGICTLTATTYNGNTNIGSKTTTFKVIVDADLARPTATITAKDVNEITKALTDGVGNSVVIGQSNILCEITKQARKKSTIKSVRVNGIELGDAESVTIEKATRDFFTIVVTDSRGFTNEEATATLEKVDYIDVSINANVVRNTPTDGKVNITFSGNYFNDTFGNVANTLDVQYKYKEKGASEYSTPQSLALTLTGNTFKGEVKEIEGFDYQKEYIFQVIATDKLTSAPKTPVEIVVNKGEPMWWWDEEAFRVLTEFLVKDRNILNEIGTLSSLSTTSKNSLVEAINEMNSVNAISVGLSDNTTRTISNAWATSSIVFDNQNFKTGSKLTATDGIIKVGAGVKSIMVGSNLMVKGVAGDIFAQIKHNNTIVSQGYYRAINSSYYGTIALSPQPIEVSEGDTISLVVGAGVTGTLTIAGGTFSWLSAELIK